MYQRQVNTHVRKFQLFENIHLLTQSTQTKNDLSSLHGMGRYSLVIPLFQMCTCQSSSSSKTSFHGTCDMSSQLIANIDQVLIDIHGLAFHTSWN